MFVTGCSFHLSQAWYRHIGNYGLVPKYRDGNEVGRWLRNIFALRFLPSTEIECCFAFELMADAPSSSQLDKFSDYVLNTYIFFKQDN